MKIIRSISLFVVIALMLSCGNQVKEVKSLETAVDSVSYAIGLSMASQLKSGFVEVNEDVLTQAIKNSLDSTNLLIEEKDIQKVISSYFQKKQATENKATKEEGMAFLEENKKKDGVITTESGLQYTVLKEGNGKTPSTEDKVKVHYHGTLIDGTVFESTVESGKPAEFFVHQVVKGWQEGLQLMKEGAKYKFFIPQELAYGATPRRGGKIKPFMALVFEIELIEILKK